MVSTVGLEPTLSGLSTRCLLPIGLRRRIFERSWNDGSKCFRSINGAVPGTRTRNLRFLKPAPLANWARTAVVRAALPRAERALDLKWWGREELNLRRRALQARALPAELRPRCVPSIVRKAKNPPQRIAGRVSMLRSNLGTKKCVVYATRHPPWPEPAGKDVVG